MRRYAKARDENEKGVIAALLAAGWSVSRLEPVAKDKGLPDLVIGKDGHTTLAEVKRPPGPRGGRKDKRPSEEQEQWHAAWRGSRVLVLDAADNAENVARAEQWLELALSAGVERRAECQP
jgi:hypothetical protein